MKPEAKTKMNETFNERYILICEKFLADLTSPSRQEFIPPQ